MEIFNFLRSFVCYTKKVINFIIVQLSAYRRTLKKVFRWLSRRIPPVPIPNTVVKTSRADNTRRVASREDRSLPILNLDNLKMYFLRLFCFLGIVNYVIARKWNFRSNLLSSQTLFFVMLNSPACRRGTSRTRLGPRKRKFQHLTKLRVKLFYPKLGKTLKRCSGWQYKNTLK